MFIIIALILILGAIFLQVYKRKGLSYPVYERPLIFHNQNYTLLINTISIALFGISIFLIAQENILYLIGLALFIPIYQRLIGGNSNYSIKIKTLSGIYSKIKTESPNLKDDFIIKRLAEEYFSGLGWNKEKIEIFTEQMFEEKDRGLYKNILTILIYEQSPNWLTQKDNQEIRKYFDKYFKQSN